MGSARLKSLEFYLDLICYDNSKTNHIRLSLVAPDYNRDHFILLSTNIRFILICLNLDCEIGFLTYIYCTRSLMNTRWYPSHLLNES